MPPITVDSLNEEMRAQVRVAGDELRYQFPIAYAANTPGLSANGQAAVFWDVQMLRGMRTAAIAGSNSASPKVPLGQPITYVYAREKSLDGILDGLRRG